MKKIYIVLTYTGTILSQIIKRYTKDEFSHISISLDIELKEMYSFGRLNPYYPFLCGFIHEYINRGTFKRFYNTKTRVYSLDITSEQYEIIKNTIIQFQKNRKQYKFNFIGLFAAGFHIKRKKEQAFYCAEFVKYIMDNAKIGNLSLPEVLKPEDFKRIDGLQEIYSGLLRQYQINNINRNES